MKKESIFWLISGMLLLATALSFMDRQVLSVSIIKIKDELSITDTEYGFINAGFLISYAIMFAVGGALIDKFGSRLGLAFSVGFWSLATALHALSANVFHFGFFRFLLGIGEGGCFPGAVKAVTEWIEPKKKAVANGIAIGGSAVGSVVAVPLCAYALYYMDWRYLFVFSGILGFIWLFFWLKITKRVPVVEVPVEGIINKRQTSNVNVWQNIVELIRNKEAVTFIMIRFLLDPIFYFYMFWIPKYLNEEKGVSLDYIGNYLWIPFLALGIANIVGGWLSDLLYKIKEDVNFARKINMGIAALLTLPVILAGTLSDPVWIVVVMSLAFFAHGIWITNYITSIGDIFGKEKASTVVGLSGSAGAVSSLVINPLIGIVIASFTYMPLWIYSGIMYPVAFLIFILFLPNMNKKLAG
jgi:ACS family hexuronate transporter-like MFS transporter